jgi:hypothetical protein
MANPLSPAEAKNAAINRSRMKSSESMRLWKKAVLDLSGDKLLVIALSEKADKIARDAVRSGLAAAVSKFAIGIRQQIPAPLKGAKKLVGSGVAKQSSKRQGAKAGFAVGRTSKVVVGRSGRNVTKSGKLKGVGLSANNVQWPVLGTKRRTVKKTRMYVGGQLTDVTNWNTGKMPAIFYLAVEHGTKAKKNEAIKAMEKKIWDRLGKKLTLAGMSSSAKRALARLVK